jgi:thermostable 8-oxoguanine DNA glycosylase
MYISPNNHKTYLREEDTNKLTEIAKYLIDRIQLPQLGVYRELSEEELWFNLLLKICAIGGASLLHDLQRDEVRFREFREKLSLSTLLTKTDLRKEYIAGILKEYKATRFYNKQAGKIDSLMNHPSVIYGGHFVLLNDLDHDRMDFREIRSRLISRNSHFKLKSASEYMIDVGLSIDVISLNVRTAEILGDHFGLKVDRHKLQDTKYIYESVEDGLRNGCNQIGIPLAYLDRMFYHYGEKDAISFILEDL